MGNIVLLDDNTINQIAAGEVIERPASVVKELMENSIDAGATAINVEIKNGGVSYIRITDNGKGIASDDMEIAFERHATSKIRKVEDLNTVKSMGFRGEALASVASISKIELSSKTADSEMGYKIQIEGGNLISKEETGCPKGTTITIKDLFFNTPVRYKFLKKDFTEAGYIEDAVTRIALVHPEIAIKLVNMGKTIIQTPGNGENKTTIYSIYGKEIAENILNVDYEYEDMKITGVIGKPIISRSNRSNQLFFVNKRYVKDKILTSAAENAYKGLITIGKFGFLILNIDMNPEKIDVNVHPAKLEVRFEEESKVFKAIYHAIKDTLLKGDLIADKEREHYQNGINPMNNLTRNNVNNISNSDIDYTSANNSTMENTQVFNKINEEKRINTPFADLFEKFRNKTNENGNEEKLGKKEERENLIAQIYSNKFENNIENIDEIKSEKKIQEDPFNITNNSNIGNTYTGIEDKTNNVNKNELIENIKKLDNMKMEYDTKNFDEMYIHTFGSMPTEARKAAEKIKEEEEKYQVKAEEFKEVENVSLFSQEKRKEEYNYKFIGIAFSTYIILEIKNELYILDQHAAHERILYEKVKQNYYNDEQKDSQLMLLPDIINLSHKEMAIAKENMEMFRKAGFTLEEFGENTIKLSGVPNICIEMDTRELFLETLDEINTVARTAKQEKEEKFIATVACKAAVKANMALNKAEVDKLMEQLLVLPNPFTCPHGRPTVIKMTKTDIEKKFARR